MTSRELKAKVAYFEKLTGYNKEYMAKKCGMGLATFYNRLNNPSAFTVKELRALGNLLNFTDNNYLAFVA